MPKLKQLKMRVENAMEDFRQTVKDVSNVKPDTLIGNKLIHDNVKIVTADSDDFSFLVPKSKQQIVVVLRGNWELLHGGVEKRLEISEITKVPMDSPFDTIMHTRELDAKFVYIQFR